MNYKISLRLLILFVVSFYFSSYAQTWNLVWSDEFDGPTINQSNWTFEIGNNNGWGNNELEYYTGRLENAKIEDGKLVITAREESYGGKNYTSARMKTQGKKSFLYGRIEAYIKIPFGQGSWPAFWTLGENISSLGWPKCGEIDIMEHVNTASVVNGTAHWANSSGAHVSEGKTTTFDISQYHLYAIEWSPTQIKWYVDYKPYFTFNIENNINSTEEFQKSQFIILNLAIGGNWPGNPNGTMQFPIMMYVDYVRVYEAAVDIEKKDEIPQGFNLKQNYPNPFNPETTIAYQVPNESQVNLKLYDSLGREVATLVNEIKQPGNYYYQFSALDPNLPNGIYFYQLTAGSFTETKKMVVLK